jgi:hypothetical protein
MRRSYKFALACVFVFGYGKLHPQVANAIAAGADVNAASARDVSAIPPLPRGKSTILGGAIRDVDPVLDRFTLGIAGEKPIKILFDERTQVFLDGQKIPLHDLRPSMHASVQTTLDGTSVFALSIHILSRLQSGDYSGEVVNYDSSTGELQLASGPGGEPLHFKVASGATFTRKGQGSFLATQSGPADLQKGTLVSLQFQPDDKGHATATEVTVLAIPGSQFVFTGNLIALDMHVGSMVLLDPRNNQTYQINFSAATLPSMPNIHPGQRVRIAAEYDGTRYLAHSVSAY